MTSTTILGNGRVGSALAAALIRSGREVVVGVRDPEAARAASAHPELTYLDVASAIERSPLIVNATPGDTSLERLSALGDALAGRVLLDVSNATTRGGDGLPGGLVYFGAGLGERLQAALPQTRVVKSLNTMLFSAMTAPGALGSTPTVFLSGDDEAAKAEVRGVLRDLGWHDDWMLDLGGIETSRGTEALALLVPSLLATLGFAPFAFAIAR
ncbi:NAD(P)-binding domain-containing protein [Herbiconiux sp.]|uniref:NADPH-dependent F420 reductase n=1 Tax=Herbiconiux sp. TaxID=1871186 RepID=UPI0025C59084|nr:NAD(P)-binding domain-containing protein [Herbiconiux sp.]